MFGNENTHVATIKIEAVLNGIHAKNPKAVLTSASHQVDFDAEMYNSGQEPKTVEEYY